MKIALDGFLDCLNNINNNKKFTIEVENDRKLLVLDVMTRTKFDGTIS